MKSSRRLSGVFASLAAENPALPALLNTNARVEATRGDLEALAGEHSSAYQHRGLLPGHRVLVLVHPCVETVAALLACWKIGSTVIPVSQGVSQQACSDLATLVGAQWLLDARVADASAALQPTGVDGGDGNVEDALLVMTSGSSGTPKAVRHTHETVLAGCTMVTNAWEVTERDRLALALPWSHVHGLIIGLLGTLLVGGSIEMHEKFDPEVVADAASRGATMFYGVPTMYHRLDRSGLVDGLRGLRLCVSGSAPLDSGLSERLAAKGVAVLERYGMTETLLTLSNPFHGDRRPGWVGLPFDGVQLRIAASGELLVKTPAASPGFLSPVAIELPVDEDGFFATGDLVEQDASGWIRIAGRSSDLIITGGVNVFPAEVEAVLLNVAGVADVAVAGRPSEEWGEEVVAWVIPFGDSIDLEVLHQAAEDSLRPSARPKRYVQCAEFPRTELGKVQRRALKG